MSSRSAAVLHDERNVVPLASQGDAVSEDGVDLRRLKGAGLGAGVFPPFVLKRSVAERGRARYVDEEMLATAVEVAWSRLPLGGLWGGEWWESRGGGLQVGQWPVTGRGSGPDWVQTADCRLGADYRAGQAGLAGP